MSQSITQVQVLTAVRYVLMLAGAWLATHGYIKDSDVNGLVSALLIIGPAAWGFFSNWLDKNRDIVAVNAGIRLATSGNALDSSGAVIPVGASAATTPPKPADMVTTPEIIKNFGSGKAA